jgi:4-amino-4-deoxy-L-arabinose transferase-like glycosyltransferase
MTAVLTRTGRHRVVSADPDYRRLVPVGLGVLALLVRALGLRTANDVFIDEVTYASFADQIAHGQLPNTGGDPFFLHPPLSFVLNALVERVFGFTGDAMDLALQLRWTNAVFGAVTVVVAYFLVRRVAGAGPALVAGLVLVTDPFVLRQDGRTMIETPAGLAVLVGWLLLLLRALDREPGPARTRRELLAGLVFGLALVTKDMTAAFTLLPLVAAGLWKRTLPWRSIGAVLVAVPLPYLVWLGVVFANGLLGDFAGPKAIGVLRMAGVIQETGFNATPDASLASRLVDMVGRFGTSYLLLGVCALAGALAAFSARPVRRLVGLLALFAGLLGVYCVVAGAAEEQFGYYVVLAAVVATPVALLELVARLPWLRRPAVVLVALFVVAGAVLGVQARTTTDDGLVQARAFMDALPAGSTVGLTSVTGEFALLPHDGWAVQPSLASLAQGGTQYVLTQSQPLSQGYGYAAPQLLDWLAAHATPVFTATGPTSGHTVVWRLDKTALDAAVASGETLPPVTGGYS